MGGGGTLTFPAYLLRLSLSFIDFFSSCVSCAAFIKDSVSVKPAQASVKPLEFGGIRCFHIKSFSGAKQLFTPHGIVPVSASLISSR